MRAEEFSDLFFVLTDERQKTLQLLGQRRENGSSKMRFLARVSINENIWEQSTHYFVVLTSG
jgi:hypothetical protein